MAEQLASPLAVAFTWMLLHFLWQGSAVAIVYWFLYVRPEILAERRKPSGSVGVSRSSSDGSCRSATNRYAVSLSMLAAMAICPIATFAWLYDPNATIQGPVVVYRWNDAADRIHMPMSSRSDLSTIVVDEVSSAIASRNQYAIALATTIDTDSIRSMLDRSQPYLLMIWGLGVFCSGFRLAAGFLNIVWLRSGVKPIPDALKHRSVLLARKLGLNVSRVFLSSRIHEAAVVGFWRPVVLLPTAWLASLPPDVLEAVIAHELAHIRRLDVWVNLLQRLLESLFFYHPAVWWLSNRVRLDREMCCDELAVQVMGNRGQYAIALEQVGRMQFFGTVSLATSFRGEGKMKLYRRIQNILRTANAPAREPAFLVGIAIAAIAMVLTGVIGNGIRSNNATAQDGEPRIPEQARTVQDRPTTPQEEEPPLTEREQKLMETVKQLQQELNELRREVRVQHPSNREEEFRPYDRNGTRGLNQADGPRAKVESSSQNIRRETLEPLMDKREMLLGRFAEGHPSVEQLTLRINSLEERIRSMEILENKGIGDRNRLWDSVANRGPREGEGMRPGPRDGERPFVGPRVGGESIRGPRDGERPTVGPRDGEGGVRGPRDGERPNAGMRDGEPSMQRPLRDGERRNMGPREGEGNVRGPRDGESPKLGPRDGESSRVE